MAPAMAAGQGAGDYGDKVKVSVGARQVARRRLSVGAGQTGLPIMHALIPEEMIERAASIIDSHAFTGRYQLNKDKRQKIAKRKAADILRLWTLAAVDAVPLSPERPEPPIWGESRNYTRGIKT
jgi:hypothetical protein